MGISDGIGLKTNPITLAYSVDNGSTFTTIASNLSNAGSYTWVVPTANTASGIVRISATDLAGNTTNLSTAAFIIDSTAPTLNITYTTGGGNTPATGKYINNSGIDITATATDTHLNNVVYSFQNLSNSQYWNGSAWVGSQTFDTLCTNASSCTVSSTISPTVTNGSAYALILQSTDQVGNVTTSSTINYTGDTVNPNLSITTASGSYLTGSVSFAGTASDTGAGLSTVKIAIKKQGANNWWNGTDWTSTTEQQLSTTTANAYANWSYVFTPSLADVSGQAYTTTVYAYDAGYKTNLSSSGSVTATLDTTGPTISGTGFWTSALLSG